MTELEALVERVRRALNQLADPERKERANRDYPTSLQVIGVRTPELRKMVKELAKQLQSAPGEQVVELAKMLVASHIFECQQVGYEILAYHKTAVKTLQPDDLQALGQGLDNWVSVDGFGVLVVGRAWREGVIPDSTIRDWARSQDPWWRRVAVVSTVALNQKSQGGTGDAPRTLDICRSVAADSDKMVAKGLSWALRELAKRDALPVLEFVDEYEHVLPAQVTREVRRKIETGRKLKS